MSRTRRRETSSCEPGATSPIRGRLSSRNPVVRQAGSDLTDTIEAGFCPGRGRIVVLWLPPKKYATSCPSARRASDARVRPSDRAHRALSGRAQGGAAHVGAPRQSRRGRLAPRHERLAPHRLGGRSSLPRTRRSPAADHRMSCRRLRRALPAARVRSRFGRAGPPASTARVVRQSENRRRPRRRALLRSGLRRGRDRGGAVGEGVSWMSRGGRVRGARDCRGSRGRHALTDIPLRGRHTAGAPAASRVLSVDAIVLGGPL